MYYAKLLLASAVLGTGLFAAWRSHQAGKVPIVPLWVELGQIEPIGGSASHWIYGIQKAAEKSATLIKESAVWTAIAVVLATLSTFVGAWSE